MPLGGPYRSLVVSSAKGYALGIREADSQTLLVRLRPSGRTLMIARTLSQVSGGDEILLSAGSGVAAIYSREKRFVTLLQGLPEAPTLAGKVSLTSLPQPLSALAVSD
ncbi:MAG TPA: hypothetical protein VH744_06450, partial [Terriglobales bacterium]